MALEIDVPLGIMSKFYISNQIILALLFLLQEVVSVHQVSTSEAVQDIGGIMNTLGWGYTLTSSRDCSIHQRDIG